MSRILWGKNLVGLLDLVLIQLHKLRELNCPAVVHVQHFEGLLYVIIAQLLLQISGKSLDLRQIQLAIVISVEPRKQLCDDACIFVAHALLVIVPPVLIPRLLQEQIRGQITERGRLHTLGSLVPKQLADVVQRLEHLQSVPRLSGLVHHVDTSAFTSQLLHRANECSRVCLKLQRRYGQRSDREEVEQHTHSCMSMQPLISL
mmetsp:Transcript_17365/g.51953  ORF Transcript_17365/g.51953 Transcript_17365/m.51953 type:complete len:203 (-) Transcript_17365:156-764(-)